MANSDDGKDGSKGVFGQARFHVARAYVVPSRRKAGILAGGALALGLVFFFLLDLQFDFAGLTSSGPLSSSHATVASGQDCSLCHSPLAGVMDEQCADCHERFGESTELFSFASHEAAARPSNEASVENEPSSETANVDCADCHGEHQGRFASLTEVDNFRCQECHEIDRFESDHPQFRHAKLAIPERAGLTFTHIKHVRRILKRDGQTQIEAACSACHTLTQGAEAFEPPSFDRHCSECHLGGETENESEPLTIVQIPASGVQRQNAPIGVETLRSIRRRLPLGSSWTAKMNDADFEIEDGKVRRLRDEHADPWILHNLALLRARIVLPGLTELLNVVPERATDQPASIYLEAIATLEEMNASLTGLSNEDVREDVDTIRRRIAELRSRVEDPNEELETAAFQPALRTDVTEEFRDKVMDVAADLASVCWKCHEGSETGMVQPQTDQRVLRNARFDHKAHVIQKNCLDCHTAIPFADFALNKEKIPRELDTASLINIPDVSLCQDCHRADLASDRCISCHDYHPHEDRRARFVANVAGEAEPK